MAGPWPFVIFARGEGKTTSRIWPLFSQSHNNELESDSYLWPLYQFHRTHSDPLDLQRTRVLFYIFEIRSRQTLLPVRASGAWMHGRFLPIIVILTAITVCKFSRCWSQSCRPTRGIEHNWSPLWSIWVSENNPKTGAHSQSFLWNLYRHESTPTSRKCSLLFGLFQYQSDTKAKSLRLFYTPVMKPHPKTGLLADL